MESLMSAKEDVVKDLLCVIAHGTPAARVPAANLLFYYWPSLNPTMPDIKAVIEKFNNSDSWYVEARKTLSFRATFHNFSTKLESKLYTFTQP